MLRVTHEERLDFLGVIRSIGFRSEPMLVQSIPICCWRLEWALRNSLVAKWSDAFESPFIIGFESWQGGKIPHLLCQRAFKQSNFSCPGKLGACESRSENWFVFKWASLRQRLQEFHRRQRGALGCSSWSSKKWLPRQRQILERRIEIGLNDVTGIVSARLCCSLRARATLLDCGSISEIMDL